MRRGEARPRAVQFKFVGDRGPGRRPVFDQGTTLLLGRETADVELSGLLTAAALGRVSGKHARITVDAASWTVEDLGSRNGTWIGRWNGQTQAREPWSRIDSGQPVVLGERDSISLADVLRIDRSGVLNAGL
jgi:pSer/pThr/pTyr-binding forkhead associated (FHA) protein